ncbi:MAG: CPBP family glutamic-type intramembrane protease, partial [Gemmatimonadales bacterium]
MPQTTGGGYWSASRAPRHSLTLALPLILLYETLAFALSREQIGAVRNGADVLLKSLFLALGGRHGVAVFGVALFTIGSFLVIRDIRKNGAIRPGLLGVMLLEAAALAAALGWVVSLLTTLVLSGRMPGLMQASGGSLASFDLPTQLMISLGAGLYEELLFRVLLVGALAWGARQLLGLRPFVAGLLAAVAGAGIFSAFHYIGEYGDTWSLASFTFRAIAGLIFSGLYLLRGFGITAWCHALYDV